jgi:hypothetical protein
MTSSSRERVLVVALGEASADLVLDWARAGELPTLHKLMHDGVSGRITCPQPFITPQMWGTVLTGTNPGRHGLFDFWQRGPDGRFHEIVGADLKAPPVWRHVNAAGETVRELLAHAATSGGRNAHQTVRRDGVQQVLVDPIVDRPAFEQLCDHRSSGDLWAGAGPMSLRRSLQPTPANSEGPLTPGHVAGD